MGFEAYSLTKRLVLRLGFMERIAYNREKGFLNPKKSFIFKVLRGLNDPESKLAHLEGETLNSLFDTLEDWNDCLERHNNDFPELLP